MTKQEMKEEVFELFDRQVNGLSYDDKIQFFEKLLVEYQKANEGNRDTSNKGNAWTDEELKIILMDTPTRANCMKYARIFKRGYGSIQQIYQWAATTDKRINEIRSNDSYVLQIKRIAKDLGLCI